MDIWTNTTNAYERIQKLCGAAAAKPVLCRKDMEAGGFSALDEGLYSG